MTRHEMITWLIERDMFYITKLSGGMEWVREILLKGFDGYSERSYQDLRDEILATDPTAFDKESENA